MLGERGGEGFGFLFHGVGNSFNKVIQDEPLCTAIRL
jgi:hypothetical protein